MLITWSIWRCITSACRWREVLIRVEVGLRTWDIDHPLNAGFNILLWPEDEDHDLDGTVAAHYFVGVDVPDVNGFVALDCYCYHGPELWANVTVLLGPDGKVCFSSNNRSTKNRSEDKITRDLVAYYHL